MYPDQRYLQDATFHRVVDQMRSLLRTYHITPSELREASILAATMHMNENITPLTIYGGAYGSISYPFLFGANASNVPLHTISGTNVDFNVKGSVSGRIQSVKTNQGNTPDRTRPSPPQQERPIKWGSTAWLECRNPKAVFDRRTFTANNWKNNTRHVWERTQSTYADRKCNEKTGDRRKENKNYSHYFGKLYGTASNRYYVCTRCGLSDVYTIGFGPQYCSGPFKDRPNA